MQQEHRVKDLRAVNNHHEPRKAEFLIAQRTPEEEKSEAGASMATIPAGTTTPIVRIKAKRLPKFHGCK